MRHQHALPGQLLLDAHRPFVRANAHGTRGIQAHQHILRTVPDRDGPRLNLWGIDRQRQIILQVRVNYAALQRQRKRAARFQHGKVCRAADEDLSPFHQLDARLPGFHAHIAAAAQNGAHLPVHHIHAHRSFDGDGVALNGSDGIAERRIVPLHQQRHRQTAPH